MAGNASTSSLGALALPGGPVAFPTPTVDSLRDSGADWIGFAIEAALDADAKAYEGDLDAAIEQLAFAETKTATARMRFCEARKIRSGR